MGLAQGQMSSEPWLMATFFCASSSSFFLGFISCLGTSKVIYSQVPTVLSAAEVCALQNICQLFFFPCHHGRVYGAILLSARLVSTSFFPRELVSCFHHLWLVLSGDVQLNPGLTVSNSSCITNNSKLNCVLLNSRSLCNQIVEFQGLVYGNNLDVVPVTETWLHDGYLDGEILSSSLYTIFRKE